MRSIHDFFLEVTSAYPQIDKRHLRVLISHGLGESIEFLWAHPETLITDNLCHEILYQVVRLWDGVPLSRLLGKREFWGIDFDLSSETLDPRPDSETLIEAILKHRIDHKESLKILDLGTGTGCLIISLLKEYPQAYGVAVDQSQSALETALQNAHVQAVADRLEVYKADWFEGISGLFDVIVSNPPYVSESDYKYLDKKVKNYDPQKALLAGEEGLDCYKIIIPDAPKFLKKQGILVLEIGQGQKEKVENIMKEAGFNNVHVYHDLGGVERCLVGTKET